jgi:hypothetical protein
MLQRRIAADLERRPIADPLLICLGDYVDRGPDSAGVLDLLLGEAPAGMKRIALLGNHEELMLRFLVDDSAGPVWFANGGDATLESYGVDALDSYDRARRQFERLFPTRHRAFLESLPISHSEGDYFFAHAGVRPGTALGDQRREDLLWIRGEFLPFDRGRTGEPAQPDRDRYRCLCLRPADLPGAGRREAALFRHLTAASLPPPGGGRGCYKVGPPRRALTGRQGRFVTNDELGVKGVSES